MASELERMVAGELYLATDEELMRGRTRARALTARYNATTQDEQGERRELLEELLGTVGENVWIEPPFYCDYGSNIHLGDRVFMNVNCVVLDVTPVRVGEGTLVGPAVQFCAATHPLDPREREQMLEYGAPITVGKNVWIGAAAVIAAGVTIGDDSVVGAGSIVVRDVPAGVLAAGNPCRIIREL